MSRTLSLIRSGWEAIRASAERGRLSDALAQLERLTRVLARPDGSVETTPGVPAELLANAHRFAGELALELGRYASARRHLKAAAAREPEDAQTRFLLGRTWEEDPDGCDRRAAICFKQATARDGASALFRAAFGRAAARCGKVKLGTRQMLAAAASAAGDVAIVRIAVSGLLETGKVEDARQAIVNARFLCPGNSELAALWEQTKFELARHAQRKSKADARTRYAQDAQLATDGDRVSLPFMRPVGTGPNAGTLGLGTGTVRCDAGSLPRPHLARLRARRAGR